MEPKSQVREKKKAQFSESTLGAANAKKKTTIILIAVLIVVVAVGAYIVLSASSNNPASTSVATSSTTAGSRDIVIPISDVSSTAKFFDYKLSDSKPVRFFVLKSSDGQYRAAMDACDMCYHAKKGYHQEGDDMVCNNCGLHFHSSQINEKHGGCNPVGLPRTIEGNQLVIKASDLETRGNYF